MKFLAKGTVHKVLQLLSVHPYTLEKLKFELKNKVYIKTLESLEGDVLLELVETGHIVFENPDLFSIGAKGKEALARLDTRVTLAETAEENRVRSNLFQSRGLYNGKELEVSAVRPGAMDYRRHPSVINGRRVYLRS